MPSCEACGYHSKSEWNYCVSCGTPRVHTPSTVSYKFVVMGTGGVGKTSISVRFIHGLFVSIYDPTIEDKYTKHVRYQGTEFVIDLLDTAGQDTFSALKELYMVHGDAFIFVYSITSKVSFLHLHDFYTQLSRRRVGNIPPLILVGNKKDLETIRTVQTEDLVRLSQEWQADYIETSAKNAENVTDVFLILIKRILEQTTPSKKKRGCVIL